MNALKTGLAALALIAVATAGAAPSFAKSGVRVGALNCVVEGGVGLILGSKKSMVCTFKPANGARSEKYKGSITRLGVDIGVTGKAYMTWAVFAPGKLKPGSLAGDYGGAGAEATVGVGLGANVLVGGFKKSVALQPLSVQGQTGLNVAAGVAGLKLRYVGK
jgi:hypothetical protein